MMMKKTTSALAVAALLGTGAASAATFQVNDDSSFSIFAGIYMTYADTTQDDGTDSDRVTDNGSEIHFSGQTEANGLTSAFYVDLDDFGLDGATTTGDSSLDVNRAEASFSGSFGEVTFGRFGAVTQGYDNAVRDKDETAIVYSPGSVDLGSAVQYSNSVNNIDFSIAAQTTGDNNVGGDRDASGTSLGGSIEADLGGVTLNVGYDSRSNTVADEPIYGASLTTMVNGIDAGLYFEKDDDPTTEADIFGLGLDYNYGNGDLYGVIQSIDFVNATAAEAALSGGTTSNTVETEDSFTQMLLGVNYNIMPNVYVYGEYLTLDRVNDEGDTVSMGAVAYF